MNASFGYNSLRSSSVLVQLYIISNLKRGPLVTEARIWRCTCFDSAYAGACKVNVMEKNVEVVGASAVMSRSSSKHSQNRKTKYLLYRSGVKWTLRFSPIFPCSAQERGILQTILEELIIEPRPGIASRWVNVGQWSISECATDVLTVQLGHNWIGWPWSSSAMLYNLLIHSVHFCNFRECNISETPLIFKLKHKLHTQH